jgi:hypothetical protein
MFQMFFGILFLVTSFLTISANKKVTADIPNLEGNYYMKLPGNGNQYVFHIDWSDDLDRYVVTVVGHSLSWATASLTIVDDTSVHFVSDNGLSLPGIVTYPTDLPSICWPTDRNYTCWKHLLSNVTRIHVINM